MATLNLLKMAREGLYVELNSAIEEAKTRGTTAQRLGVRVRDDGHFRELNIKVVPVKMTGMSESCFLVLFEAADVPPGKASAETTQMAGPRSGGRAWAVSWLKGWFAAPRPGPHSAVNDSAPITETASSLSSAVSSLRRGSSTNQRSNSMRPRTKS